MKNETLLQQAALVLKDHPNDISLLANASAFLFETLLDINWVGFYLLENQQLTLGPFQGRVACTTIEVGKGVCGQAVLINKPIIVDDVHQFEGHIACDTNSKSEMVIPIVIRQKIYGVLDVDSPIYQRFDEETASFLKRFVYIIENELTLLQ